MRILGANRAAISPASASRRAASERREPQAPETDGRALIAIEGSTASERLVTTPRHPAAPFLAHLIATQMQAPQTRARRRAEPEEAIGVYRHRTLQFAGRRFEQTA